MFGLFGNLNDKEIKKLDPLINQINGFEEAVHSLTKAQMQERIQELRTKALEELNAVVGDEHEAELLENEDDQERFKEDRLKKVEQQVLNSMLPEVFALTREAAQRTLKERHFNVQLLGGIVLHEGKIAEMRTGEGKTLVATLPAVLNALTGKGVHIVTVNDYLAKRDAAWMGRVYDYLGLSVAAIGHESSMLFDPKKKEALEKEAKEAAEAEGEVYTSDESPLVPITRKEAYEADITYGTNNEFGFDYLRDNMAQEPAQMVQRGLHYSIVDEVDSILIDEARTPLIISAPAQESGSQYVQFAKLVKNLEAEKDYTVDEKLKAVTLTDDGISKFEKLLGVENIYQTDVMLVHHLEEALKAQVLFARDKDYVVKDGEVVIVDEFTGRLMPGRRYSEGLHQAIEAKEGVEVKQESLTLATISFQNLFRLYQKLSGMTGTAATEAEEFHKIYHLDVVEIPTNKPPQRIDLPDQIYKTVGGKFQAIVEEVAKRTKEGQPVLIGTVSIERNELLSKLLQRAGIKHEVLNAKNHEREAHIVAKAGYSHAVTVATNMAGRGTDIKLEKGNPAKGGLHVIGTERHESRRIDNQLRGRTGRQGDPGSSQFFISMEDDLMRIFGGDRLKNVMNALKLPEDQPIEHKMISRSIEGAQKKVEGHNFDIRKHLVEYDDVMNKHREVIYRRRRRILHATAEDTNTKLKESLISAIEGRVRFVLESQLDNEGSLEKGRDEIAKLFGIDLINTEASLDAIMERVRAKYEEREKSLGSALMRQIERTLFLRTIDNLWIEHLTNMDHLRDGIGLRGYGQYDPLVAYKQEAFRMFEELLQQIDFQVAQNIFRIEVVQQAPPKPRDIELTGANDSDLSKPLKEHEKTSAPAVPKVKLDAKTEKISKLMQQESSRQKAPVDTKKIGRNDPCWCGSGRKFKKCHGK